MRQEGQNRGVFVRIVGYGSSTGQHTYLPYERSAWVLMAGLIVSETPRNRHSDAHLQRLGVPGIGEGVAIYAWSLDTSVLGYLHFRKWSMEMEGGRCEGRLNSVSWTIR